MLTLAILRHVKSSWEEPHLDDFSRPLAPRGIAAAPLMGKELGRQGIAPQTILCSAAVRARETLRLALPDAEAGGGAVHIEAGLYVATAEMLLERLKRLPAKTSPVLLIGHNPSLHNLALALAGTGRGEDLVDLARHFPTGALAVLTFEAARWSDIAVRAGRLVHFTTPRRLSGG